MNSRQDYLDKINFKPQKETSTIPISFVTSNEITIDKQIQEHLEKRELMNELINQSTKSSFPWIDYFVNKKPFEVLKKVLIGRNSIEVFNSMFNGKGEFNKEYFDRFVSNDYSM